MIHKETTRYNMEEMIARSILDNQVMIPKEEYVTFFQLEKAPYTFPTLKTDEYGIFTGEVDEYDTFDTFKVVGTDYSYKLTNPDLQIEQFIMKHEIKQMRINLERDISGTFRTHKCSVYPLSTASCSAVYDTLYLSDYLLKLIYRILMATLINGAERDYKQETFMISMREIEGAYKVSNIEYHYGFMRLDEFICDFVHRNQLEEKQDAFRAEYEQYKKEKTIMSASISYQYIRYSLEDNLLQFKKLKPKINITSFKDDEAMSLPSYALYMNQFFDEYYDDIKGVFTIYHRLENMYRLCALNVVLNQFNPDTEQHDTEYVDTYPASIMCSGGVVLAPTSFIQVPFKGHPIVDATQKNIDVKVCREAFDNGGFICAFAPKLKIRDCFDKNLKDFHECLEEK
jgi:hypothetical protein